MIQEPRDSEAMDGCGDDDAHSAAGGRAKRVFSTRKVPIDRQRVVPGLPSVLGGYDLEAQIFAAERMSKASRLSTLPPDMLFYYMNERYLRSTPAVKQWSINHLFEGRNVPAMFQAMGSYICVKEFAVRGPSAYFSATLNFPNYAVGLFVIIVSIDGTEPRVVELDVSPMGSLVCGTDSEHHFRFDLVNKDTEFCVTIFQNSGNFICFFSLDGVRNRVISPPAGNATRNSLPSLHRMHWVADDRIVYYDQSHTALVLCREFDLETFAPLSANTDADIQQGTANPIDPCCHPSTGVCTNSFLTLCETGFLRLAPVSDQVDSDEFPQQLSYYRYGTLEHDCCSPDGSYVLRTNNSSFVYIFETKTKRLLTKFPGVDWAERSIAETYIRTFACCLIDNNHYCSVRWGSDGVTVEIRG